MLYEKLHDLLLLYEERPVTVEATAPLATPIQLTGLTIPALERGEEVDLPLWVAILLSRFGVVRFKEDPFISQNQIFKVRTRERFGAPLSSLEPDFHTRLAVALRYHELSALSDQRLRRIAKQIIMSFRLQKICHSITLPIDEEQLSAMEAELVKQLRDAVASWHKFWDEMFQVGEQ